MEEKLKEIIHESLELFKKYSIRSISMDDIARELSISKKTLYQHVSGKPDLIEKTLRYVLETENPACTIGDKTNMNAIDILLAVSKSVSAQLKNFNPVNAFELEKYYPTIYRDFVMQKRDHIFEQTKKNMMQGMQEGIYRTDVDADLVARLYVQKLVDVHNPEFLSSVNFSFEKVFQVMFDNHIRGICNAKGLAYYENKLSTLSFS